MNNDYNDIEKIVTNLKNNHENNKSNSLYLYGKSGIGKTTTVKKILQNNNIDYLYYDINNLKDRTNFNNTFYSNTGNVNIMNCFFKQTDNKIIYVIDNIDHIQNNEKIFLGNIIKAIRPRKKTKKITDNKKNKKNKTYIHELPFPI
jgi:Cdc6-like AAA superfamily ATPase